MNKKYFVWIVALATIFCLSLYVQADELQQNRDYCSIMLSSLQEQITNLQQKQNEIVEKIDEKNSNIVDLNIKIEQAKITIEKKQEEIKQKQIELNQAEQQKEQQYQGMKTRIQYLYENGQNIGLLELLFQQNNINDFLNKIQFTEQLYQTDRNLLNDFVQQIELIEQKEQELGEQKQLLELEKKGLEQNVQQLEEQIQKLKQDESLIGANIQEVNQDAAALAYEIAEIDRLIAEKQAEKQALIQYQESLNVIEDIPLIDAPAASQLTSQELTSYSSIETKSYTSSSSDVVSYANQFVGNPYVWGGNSLTSGADCSHFVWNVLKDTGHYDGGYAVADDWVYLGQSVSSLDQAQAGDVIVYSGHVAIYDGNGGIIQAQSSQAGITNNRAAQSGTITAIRHFE